jgi:diguanylate cyclase (GGDEF)-like protein/PAS domain S-box-containing protein
MRALFELSPIGVAEFDPAGRILAANAAFGTLLGYEPAELVGMDGRDLVDGSTEGAVSAVFGAADPSRLGDWRAERTLLAKDGRLVTAVTATNVVRDSTGAVERVIGSVIDVSELQAARNALELSRRQLAAAQRIAGLGSWHVDHTTGEQFLSTELHSLLALPAATPTSVDLLISLIVPEQREEARAVLMAARAGGFGPYDVAVRRWDGERRVFETRGARVAGRNGMLRHTYGTFRDVTESRALQEQLRGSETRARQLMQAIPDAVLVTDADGRIEEVNAQAVNLFGYAAGELIGRPVEALVPAALQDAHRAHRSRYAAATSPTVMSTGPTVVAVRKDGTAVPVEVNLGAIDLPTGPAVLASVRDVSARQRAERDLRESEQRFRLAFDDAPIGMALVSLEPGEVGRYQRVNRAMCRLTGHSEADLVGRSVADITHPDDRVATLAAMDELAAGALPYLITEKRYRHADGRDIWAHVSTSVLRHSDGQPAYTVTQVEDITARKQAEERLTHQALHDGLTGLPNRTLLIDHLTQALARAARSGLFVGVLFIDLDDFKLINDSLGHNAGDELLVAVASRISECLRDTDTAARLGGDEFVIVCEDLHSPDEVELVADRLERRLRMDLSLRERAITLSASLGVATSTVDSTPESLLRDSDAAMYRAKDHGKGRYEIADVELQARAMRQITLEAGLRRALIQGELALVYQPCFDLATGRVTAVEALLRWHHPERGVLGPDSFLDVAENRDLIAPLGAWVIRTACAQAADWERRFGAAAPDVWVNISSRQLGKHELTRTVTEALAETGLPTHRLGLEITERQAIGAAHSVRADLRALPEMGVRLAIDDFGTGHNGLDYLRGIPLDTLKIDKSYVAGLGADRTDTALTRSMITLAHSLDLLVVAEGVETRLQHDELCALGCDFAQGFLLGRPGPAAAVDDLLLRSVTGPTR